MSKPTKLATHVASCVECAIGNGISVDAMSVADLTRDLIARSICGNYAHYRVERAVRSFRRSRRYTAMQRTASALAQ